MDFHSFTRRELQALCKKNKIPANMTNVAMADALQSLEFVDGIEEVLKTCESDVANSSVESPGKSEAVTSVPRTGRRTTQRKTTKHDSESLQTSKNDMHETPALPTTRRRAATTSVRAKLESVMKECEPKEKIGDQVEEEKKDVLKTPVAARASQRKGVKAKSSVRQVCSTRRSVRLAGNVMQEPSTQGDEKSGTLTFDAVSEETDESLEVNSELHSVHKTEELDENGVVQSFESLDIKDESDTVSGQDSNTLVQNDEKEDGVQQDSGNDLVVVALDTKAKEGSEEVALGHNNNGSEEISGEEPMEESEIDAEAKKEKDFQNKSQNLGDDAKSGSDITNVVLTKQLNKQDEPHCGDASDFVTQNDGKEEDNFNQTFECQVDEGAECNSDVAGQQELIGEPVIVNPDTDVDFHEVNLVGQFNGEVEAAKPASQQKCLTNMQANIDFLEVNLFEQFNVEVEGKVSGSQQKCLTNMENAGEEEPMEEYDVDCTEANVDAPADSLEVAGEEEASEEYDVDCTEANVDAPADSLEVAGEEPVEEYDVDCTEANTDAPADALEVAGEEEFKEGFEVDYAEVTVESAAHSLPPLPLIPNAAQQCLHVSETNTEVPGEESTEESEIDHVEANVDSPAHALPPPASLMPNAAPEPVFTLTLDPMQNPSTLASTNPELITKTPLENSSAATSIGQILVSDNKENLVCAKENKGTAGNNNKQSLQNLSLRKLTKMLKDLTISKDPSGKEAASSRSALQKLPENRLTSENKN